LRRTAVGVTALCAADGALGLLLPLHVQLFFSPWVLAASTGAWAALWARGRWRHGARSGALVGVANAGTLLVLTALAASLRLEPLEGSCLGPGVSPDAWKLTALLALVLGAPVGALFGAALGSVPSGARAAVEARAEGARRAFVARAGAVLACIGVAAGVVLAGVAALPPDASLDSCSIATAHGFPSQRLAAERAARFRAAEAFCAASAALGLLLWLSARGRRGTGDAA
jgi:hypothetical protein